MARSRHPTQHERAAVVGTRLRRRRRELRLTQREVADRVPMSAGNLSRIENAEQGPPSDEVLEQLAKALELPASELFQLARGSAPTPDAVLAEIRQMREEMRTGFERLERALAGR
jgi:transcriptional regulator with XRE-family HTH domain